jgi:hypothetical protein
MATARTALPFSLAALALLGACAAPYDTHTGTPVASSTGTPVTSASGTAVVSSPAVVTGQPVLITSGPVQPGAVIVPASNVFRSGTGIVEAVQAIHIAPAATASAGASAPERLAYRLSLRMSDGSMQAVDQDNPGFRVGDRVEIAPDGKVSSR